MRRVPLVLLLLLAACADASTGPDPYACRPGCDTLTMVPVRQGVYERLVPLCLCPGAARLSPGCGAP